MTRRRWIADEVSGNRAALLGSHADHLATVLRARVGQEFDVVAEGRVHHAHIIKVESGRVDFELGPELAAPVLPALTLAISVFKFDRMEWAIEKATELGAARIVPLISQRTEKHLAVAALKRVERWRRIAAQASEQARLPATPEIADPAKLKDIAPDLNATRIVLSEAEETLRLKDALSVPAKKGVWLAFGPEGGWTEAELKLFRSEHWILASLGPTILRAETAVIAALSVAMAELV